MVDLTGEGRKNTVSPVGIVRASGLRRSAELAQSAGRLGAQLWEIAEERVRAAEQKYVSETGLAAVQKLSDLERQHYEDPEGFLNNSLGTMEAAVEAAPDAVKENIRDFYARNIASKQQVIENRVFERERLAALQSSQLLSNQLLIDRKNTAFQKGLGFIPEFEGSVNDYVASLQNQRLTQPEVQAKAMEYEQDVIDSMVQGHTINIALNGTPEEFEKFKQDFVSLGEDEISLGANLAPDQRLNILGKAERVFNNYREQAKETVSLDAKIAVNSLIDQIKLGVPPNVNQINEAKRLALTADNPTLAQKVNEIESSLGVINQVKGLPIPEIANLLQEKKNSLSESDTTNPSLVGEIAVLSDFMSGALRELKEDPRGYFENTGRLQKPDKTLDISDITPDFMKQRLVERETFLKTDGVGLDIFSKEQTRQLKSILDNQEVSVTDKIGVLQTISSSVMQAFSSDSGPTNSESRQILSKIRKELDIDEDYAYGFALTNAALPAASDAVNYVMIGKQLKENPKELSAVSVKIRNKLTGLVDQPEVFNSAIDVAKTMYKGMAISNEEAWETADDKMVDKAVEMTIGSVGNRGVNIPFKKNNKIMSFRNQKTGQWVSPDTINTAIDRLLDEDLSVIGNGTPIDAVTNKPLSALDVRRTVNYRFIPNGLMVLTTGTEADSDIYRNEDGDPYVIDMQKLVDLVPEVDTEDFYRTIERKELFDKATEDALSFGTPALFLKPLKSAVDKLYNKGQSE